MWKEFKKVILNMAKWRYKLEFRGKALREAINNGGEDLDIKYMNILKFVNMIELKWR